MFYKQTSEKSIDLLRDNLSTQIYTSVIDNTDKSDNKNIKMEYLQR